MKKIFYLASIAALAFSSCAKDETAEVTLGVAGSGKIMATAGEADDTRAYLDSNQKFRWQANDGLGVYNDATYPMNNDEYVLTEGAESATGIFVGQKKFDAKHHHVAVYPRLDQNLMPNGVSFTEKKVPSAKDAKAYVPNAITVQIPATQKYQPGSFYSKTVPAVSTIFNVDANGDAAIKMQPVADYLFVNIKSTEPITKIGLKLLDVKNGRQEVKLAGNGDVKAYNLNGNIRYYLPASALTASTSTAITLETGTFAADLTCHEPNTFVFVIPAGILGANNQVEAYIWINEDAPATGFSGYDFAAINGKYAEGSSYKNNAAYSDNTQMNGYWNNNGTSTTQDDVTIIRGEEEDDRKHDPNGVYETYNMQLENMVFWMNDKDSKGNRTSFTYNPDNAYIIEHEGDLLKYLTDYNKADKSGRVDAYICDNHSFDFSVENIADLSDDLKELGVYSKYETYFANYLAGSFPCIADSYYHEFNGNGAVISGIVMPLASKYGIFGKIGRGLDANGKVQQATIKDVTFADINAATWHYTTLDTGKVYLKGLVLGYSITNYHNFSNITVDNATGLAILGQGNVADYSALTIKNAEGLNFIIADMALEDDLKFKNWDAVSAVKNNVFGALDAKGHKVATLPADADYSDLAAFIGNKEKLDLTFLADGTNGTTNVVNPILAQVVGFPSYYYYEVGAIDTTDADVVSVLVGDESYWTGDKTNWTNHLSAIGKHSSGAYKGFYKINYAEQLAMGADASTNAQIQRNMNLSYSPMPWTTVTVKQFDGNGKTVSGVYMYSNGVAEASFANSSLAPVDAYSITNLTVDGVELEIETPNGYVVPHYVSGLALKAHNIENVTVKNLVITGAGAGNNNEQYYDSYPTVIGWLVANGTMPTIKNANVQGVNNEIKGVAALVGEINLTSTNNAASITNSSATDVIMIQEALTAPVQVGSWFTAANYAGNSVGYLTNNSGSAKSITFDVEPAFIFNAASTINVIVGGTSTPVKNR